ncbi:glycosyltransferase [uncultured Dechloromonas sp.]|uniref:glycosyltransferase n=1 Tax=uncultured Dechloromonas sp. TaxID=171719 RepID=UPI0025F80B85|nr:glycosyltransferase [uncultured Dechloromonas sp.]
MDLLAVSYMLPPNLYPQAIQVGRMLHNLPARIGVVCGQVHQFASGLDCYPDFDEKLSYRLEVPFSPRLSGWTHRLAVYGFPLYARSPDEFKSWVPDAEKAVLAHFERNPERPQALLTFGEPMSDHLLGLRLKQKLALPWVAHFSDPWSDNPFRRRFPLSNFLNRRYEAQVVRHADRVIFTSQETLDLVMRKYPGEWRAKARVLPHGFEPALYGERQREGDDSIVLRYLGNFYGNRSPLPLFKALAILHRESPSLLEGVRVELVGHIPPRMFMNSAYRALPAGLVQTVSTVSYRQSLRLMADADLLLVIDAPEEFSVFLPSKLVDYLGAGVPILGIVPPGASAKLISRMGGEVANPRDLPAVVDSLRRSIADCRQAQAEKRNTSWGNSTVRQQYCADTVAERLHSIISEVVA